MIKLVEDLARSVVKAVADKKAENIVVLDISPLSVIADYFIICHGNNERQVQAIVTEIRETAHQQGYSVRIEGAEEGRWVLVDLNEVVVHVFHKEDRDFYNIERLWGDAMQVSFDQE